MFFSCKKCNIIENTTVFLPKFQNKCSNPGIAINFLIFCNTRILIENITLNGQQRNHKIMRFYFIRYLTKSWFGFGYFPGSSLQTTVEDLRLDFKCISTLFVICELVSWLQSFNMFS